MSLDKNLFTLNLEPSQKEPGTVDLVDPSGTVHYRKRMEPNDANLYQFCLSEPLSESTLATATAPSAVSKEKVIELHNPSATVPLTLRGTLTFKWVFVWEGNTFEWKRDSCYMVRKPDPPVIVAVTRELAGKIKTATVQILDYNLNRFDIEDRKGLEIILLTSLLTFGDYSEQLRTKNNSVSPVAPIIPSAGAVAQTDTQASLPPPPPPPPPPKEEVVQEDQIAILQAKEQRDVNEVVVGDVGTVDEYVNHCVSLLKDDALLFISLRSYAPTCVSKVVQVAEATKRTRYKISGYDDEQELHQYVDMSFDEKQAKGKGQRVINLDDPPTATPSYKPPTTLTIHLSKVAMPELQPKASKPKFNISSRPTEGASGWLSSLPFVDKRGPRSSSVEPPIVRNQPPRATSPPPTGLRAKLGALTSKSSSPPPRSRRHSVAVDQLAAVPLKPQQKPNHQPQPPAPRPKRMTSDPRLRPPSQPIPPLHSRATSEVPLSSSRSRPQSSQRPQSYYPPQPFPQYQPPPPQQRSYPPAQQPHPNLPPGPGPRPYPNAPSPAMPPRGQAPPAPRPQWNNMHQYDAIRPGPPPVNGSAINASYPGFHDAVPVRVPVQPKPQPAPAKGKTSFFGSKR